MTISDPRGLEVRCHGGGQSAAVDLLPGDDHRDHRHPDGRPPHIRVRGPGQDHRHLPRQVDAGTASDTLLHHTAATTCHVDTYREPLLVIHTLLNRGQILWCGFDRWVEVMMMKLDSFLSRNFCVGSCVLFTKRPNMKHWISFKFKRQR